MSAYLSVSDSGELEVRVRVISRIALFTSMMDVAQSMRNIRRIIVNNVAVDLVARFPPLCQYICQ